MNTPCAKSPRLRSAKLSATVGFVVAGISLALPAAHATTRTTVVPPWEPDPAAAAPYGTLEFFNAAGQEIYSGTSLDQLFSYVEASTALAPAGVNKATVEFAAPNHSLPTGSWFTAGESPATADPDAAAPGALATSGNPVVETTDPGDVDVNAFIGNATMDTTAGYADIIQVRVFTTQSRSSNTSLPNYWDADIAYNTGSAAITVDGVSVPAGGWAELYPTVPPTGTAKTTKTTLKGAPNPAAAPTAKKPSKVTYTAKVAPVPTGGTVGFTDGGAAIAGCTAQPLTSGAATCIVNYTAAGTHTIVATYSGTTGFKSSVSATWTETVK